MPINSPTGFLDITNATLRTSNLEAQNLLITGGNIYVTSELEADATVLNLENVTRKGNVSSNTIEITNVTTGIVATGNVHALKFIGSGSHLTDIPSSAISGTLSQWSDGANSDVYIASNVGIGNVHTLTSNTLQVGGNLYVRDTDANVLTVNGNVVASYFEGDGSKLSGIVTDLQGVTDNGNVTTNVVQFSNVTTGLVTTANIEVGGDIKVVGLSAGTVPYVASDKFLKDSFITMTGDATVITSNLDVTGNIFMRGKKFIVESETKLINDAIIGIANNNTVSTTDKGIIMQNTTGNVAIIHHGTGDGFADQLTFGYTADPLDTVTVTNDLTKELTVNVLGNVITQNNLSIGGLLKINTISAASSHSLQAVTNLGNVTSNTVQFSNAITSLVASSNIVATGNVSAGRDTDTTSYFGRAAVGYMGTSDQASFAHFDRNSSAQYALKQTAAGPTYINTPASGHIRFTVNDGNAGAEKMRITSAGNVGIGVSAPHANLHVEGNVYVSSNLTVSGNVSDLNVVSNVNMLQTANTAAIKLNSNVVTEFPRSKKLIKYPRVALTANSSGGYLASSSTVYTEPYKAFDTILYTSYFEPVYNTNPYPNADGAYTGGSGAVYNTNGYEGDYLQLQLPEKIKLYEYSISKRGNQDGRFPKDAKIFASNDGSTWIDIHTISNNVDGDTVLFKLTHLTDTYYSYYRLVVNSIIEGGSSDTPNISDWSLFGVPEYDPEAHGTDMTVKSYPNVPNADWLEVYYDAKGLADNSTTVNDLKPVGTAVNGVVNGNTSVTDGAFTFDGTGDYIQGTFSGHTLSSGYTMATWIKPGDIGVDDYIATFGVGSTGTSFGINFETVEGAFRAFIWGPSTPGIVAKTGSGAVAKDKWVHIAATFISASGSIHLYIDNKLAATGTGTTITSISASAPLVLGARNGGGTIQRHANFTMANFRLFNRALTSDEIYQLYAYQKEDFGYGDLSMTLKAGRLGIGTSEPRAALDVRGDVRGGCPVYFQAKLTNSFAAGIYNNSINGAVIPWDQLYENTGCYNTTTGLFTAPMTAVYKFGYGMRSADSSKSHYWTYIQKNGAAAKSAGDHPGRIYCGQDDYDTQSATFIMDLRAGDTVGILLASTNTSPQISNSYGYFHGHYFGESRGQHDFWD